MEQSFTNRLNLFFSVLDSLNQFHSSNNINPENEISLVDILCLSLFLESLPAKIHIRDYCCNLSGGKTTAFAVFSEKIIRCHVPNCDLGQKLCGWNNKIDPTTPNPNNQTDEPADPAISIIPVSFLESKNSSVELKLNSNRNNSAWIVVGFNQHERKKFLPNLIRSGYQVNLIGNLMPGLNSATLALVCSQSSELRFILQDNLNRQFNRNYYQSLIKGCIDQELYGNPDHSKNDINRIIAHAIHLDNQEVNNKKMIWKICHVLVNEGIYSLIQRATKKIYYRFPGLFRKAS